MELPRSATGAVVREEAEGLPGDPIGLFEEDRHSGVLLLGSPGTGKTTTLLSIVRGDVAYRDARGRRKCVVVLDIGKDTARRALGMVPKERDVAYFAPHLSDCPWALNPFLIPAPPARIADSVLQAMIGVFGEDTIMANSQMFLRETLKAVLEVEPEPDLVRCYDMLHDREYRDGVARRVTDDMGRRFWRGQYLEMEANDPRGLEGLLAPPRNKFVNMLSHPGVRAAVTGAGRRVLDFDDLIRSRGVLVCDFPKVELGEDGARLLGVFVLVQLWYAMQAQRDLPEEERVSVSIVVDEAQNFLTGIFADLLNEGRAYGAQVTAAMRYLEEVPDKRVRDALKALVENVVIHRFALVDEAEERTKQIMRVYANMLQVDAELKDLIYLGPDDLMNLPRHWSICRFLAHGTPTPAFVGISIPWEPCYREEDARHHLARNRVRALPPAPAPDLGPGVDVLPDEVVIPDDAPDLDAAFAALGRAYPGADARPLRVVGAKLGASAAQMAAAAAWIARRRPKADNGLPALYRDVLRKMVAGGGGGLREAVGSIAARYRLSGLLLEGAVREAGVGEEAALGAARWLLDRRDIPPQKALAAWRGALSTARAREILRPVVPPEVLEQAVRAAKGEPPARVEAAAAQMAGAERIENPVGFLRSLLKKKA